MDTREARLSSCALVAMVGGSHPKVSIFQVGRLLEEFLNLIPEDFEVQGSQPDDFLVQFNTYEIVERILHSHLPAEVPFQLIWRRWRRQSRASLASMRFRVLIELQGVPAHARDLETAQIVLASACSNLVEAPPQLAGDNNAIWYLAGISSQMKN